MKKLIWFGIFAAGVWLGLSVPGAYGQSAKVIALTPQEAAQAKQLDDNVKAAMSKRKHFYDEIQHKYTQTMTLECATLTTFSGAFLIMGSSGQIEQKSSSPPPPSPPCKKEPVYRDKTGWGIGFIYSEDYKYIVPSVPEPSDVTCGPISGCSPRLRVAY